MSFMYPRTIVITRPAAQTGVGAQGYGGLVTGNETKVADSIPCSIQERREGTKNDGGLASDALKPSWYIFIQKKSAALGLIQDRDVVTDDIGVRYQVSAAYFDSLGYRLTATTLET